MRRVAPRGFTLIELLVVMGIIGVLASLTVGLVSVASRSQNTKRAESDLNELVTLIENYKSDTGSYPPDNPGKPGLSPLFYELSGTTFDAGLYSVAGVEEKLGLGFVNDIFNPNGFGNTARSPGELKSKHNFKPNQHKKFTEQGAPVQLLTSPQRGPSTTSRPAADGTPANVWQYVRTNPQHNRSSFDLWIDISIGTSVVQIHNW